MCGQSGGVTAPRLLSTVQMLQSGLWGNIANYLWHVLPHHVVGYKLPVHKWMLYNLMAKVEFAL